MLRLFLSIVIALSAPTFRTTLLPSCEATAVLLQTVYFKTLTKHTIFLFIERIVHDLIWSRSELSWPSSSANWFKHFRFGLDTGFTAKSIFTYLIFIFETVAIFSQTFVWTSTHMWCSLLGLLLHFLLTIWTVFYISVDAISHDV